MWCAYLLLTFAYVLGHVYCFWLRLTPFCLFFIILFYTFFFYMWSSWIAVGLVITTFKQMKFIAIIYLQRGSIYLKPLASELTINSWKLYEIPWLLGQFLGVGDKKQNTIRIMAAKEPSKYSPTTSYEYNSLWLMSVICAWRITNSILPETQLNSIRLHSTSFSASAPKGQN